MGARSRESLRHQGLRAVGIVLAVSLSAQLLAGCTAKRRERPSPPPAAPPAQPVQEIRFNLGAEPSTLDPGFAQDNPSAVVIYQLFEGLVQKTPEGLKPAMARAWEVSPDGRTYTFKLRECRWSNGDPVRAGDFEFSWKRALNPARPSPYAHILYPIAGAEEYNTADPAKLSAQALQRLREAVGVKAVDDRTLQVKLREPAPYFLELAAFFTFLPVSPRAVAEGGDRWAEQPGTLVVNGPFRVREWKRRNELVLERNPGYCDAAAVRLKRLRLFLVPEPAASATMYANGEIDMSMAGLVPPDEVPELLKRGEARRAPFLATYYLIFNTQRRPFNDVRVRRALALAIDRGGLAARVLRGGEPPALAFVPPGIVNPATGRDFRAEGGGYFRDADAEEARRLLAEAGFPQGKGFPRVTLLYNTEGTHRQVMEAIREMWRRELGIEVNLAGQDWNTFTRTKAAGDFHIARGGWIGDYGDPLSFLEMWTSESRQNEARWRNAAYDRAIARARQEADAKARMEALHDAERLLMEEMPVAPLYFYMQVWQQKDFVRDVFIDVQGNVFFKRAFVAPHGTGAGPGS